MPDDGAGDVKGVHVCTTRSQSGIAAYALDFQRLVLGPTGYTLADPDNADEWNYGDVPFHVQLGVFQSRERTVMTRLIKQGLQNVEATIHDPPFLTFPYVQFQSALLMRLSRGFDWYLGSFGLQRRRLEQLRRIFVLSNLGREALLRLAPKANVVTIPHIVDRARVWGADTELGDGLLYFGFIGPNKGLEYVLELHRKLREVRPHTPLHVIGQASGSSGQRYLAKLKENYQEDVFYHGYIPDNQLDALFAGAAQVILPYQPYKYIVPTSGSVIHALRRARVVWTTGANAMSETIRNGENGFILSMNSDSDARRLAAVMEDCALLRRVSEGARQTALAMANYPYQKYFSS